MCIAIKAMKVNTQNQFAVSHAMTSLLSVCRRASSHLKTGATMKLYCDRGGNVRSSFHAAADSLILTRFNSSALATTIRVEPDIESAATSGLSSHPVKG